MKFEEEIIGKLLAKHGKYGAIPNMVVTQFKNGEKKIFPLVMPTMKLELEMLKIAAKEINDKRESIEEVALIANILLPEIEEQKMVSAEPGLMTLFESRQGIKVRRFQIVGNKKKSLTEISGKFPAPFSFGLYEERQDLGNMYG